MAFLKGCATTPRNGIKLNNDLSDVAKEASILLKPLKSVNPFMKQYPWWFETNWGHDMTGRHTPIFRFFSLESN